MQDLKPTNADSKHKYANNGNISIFTSKGHKTREPTDDIVEETMWQRSYTNINNPKESMCAALVSKYLHNKLLKVLLKSMQTTKREHFL